MTEMGNFEGIAGTPTEGGGLDGAEPDLATPTQKELFRLDPQTVRNEMLQGLISMGVLLTAGVAALLIYWYFRSFDWIAWGMVGAILLLLVLIGLSSFLYPGLAFRHTRWCLDDESLEIRRGVYWKHRIAVPLGRVQHADVSQGPLQRYFGLGKLIVHTAGTYQASVELDGISYETALRLRDQLVQQSKPKFS